MGTNVIRPLLPRVGRCGGPVCEGDGAPHGCGDVCRWAHWMGSGKPPLPCHPVQDVPTHHRARADRGRTYDLLGLLTQPPEIGPKGRHLHCPASRTSD